MPLAGSGPVLGAALGAVTGPSDPAATAAWIGVSSPLVAYLVSNTTVLPGTMSASGSAVSGQGLLLIDKSGAAQLAIDMAAGAGAKDGQAQWRGIADTILSWVESNGLVNPTAFVASPTGGPVEGDGSVSFGNTALGAALRSAVGATDAASVAVWAAIGSAILNHIATATVVNPTPIGLASPNGGGPLTGTGSIA